MSRDETKKILTVMLAAFPSYKPNDLGAVVALWTTMFQAEPYRVVEQALMAFIASDTSGFAPTVGQLKNIMVQEATKGEYGEMEAWALVRRAIGRSSYGAEEEFAKLPETIQLALGGPATLRAWAQDEDFNESVASSNFCRAYRNAIERRRRELAIRPVLVEAIEQIGAEKLLGGKI